MSASCGQEALLRYAIECRRREQLAGFGARVIEDVDAGRLSDFSPFPPTP